MHNPLTFASTTCTEKARSCIFDAQPLQPLVAMVKVVDHRMCINKVDARSLGASQVLVHFFPIYNYCTKGCDCKAIKKQDLWSKHGVLCRGHSTTSKNGVGQTMCTKEAKSLGCDCRAIKKQNQLISKVAMVTKRKTINITLERTVIQSK